MKLCYWTIEYEICHWTIGKHYKVSLIVTHTYMYMYGWEACNLVYVVLVLLCVHISNWTLDYRHFFCHFATNLGLATCKLLRRTSRKPPHKLKSLATSPHGPPGFMCTASSRGNHSLNTMRFIYQYCNFFFLRFF